MKTLRFPPYYQKKVQLEKYGYVPPFVDAVLNSSDHRLHVFVSETNRFDLKSSIAPRSVLLLAMPNDENPYKLICKEKTQLVTCENISNEVIRKARS